MTPTEIVNNALGHLGADPIADLDTNTSKIGRLARRQWQPTVDECIADHPWNYFKERQALEADADYDDPLDDWSYGFTLPTDPHCLRVLATSMDSDGQRGAWTVEGRHLLANDATVEIVYLARKASSGDWPPLFVTALEYRLASKLAYAVTRMAGTRDAMMSAYMAELGRARGGNGQEGPGRVVQSRTLIEVR